MATNRKLEKPVRIHWKVVAGEDNLHPIQMSDICLTTDEFRFYNSLKKFLRDTF